MEAQGAGQWLLGSALDRAASQPPSSNQNKGDRVGEPETTGTILARTDDLVRGNAVAAAIAIIALATLDTLLDASPRQSFAVSGIVSFVAQYGLTVAALQKLGLMSDGERGSRMPAMFGLLFVTGLATFLGIVLLIVPGVILVVRWSIAVPILLAERATIREAMRQSWERTAGRFWPIFGVIAIYFGVLIAASAVAVLVFAGNPVGTFVMNLLINIVAVGMWYAAIAIYQRARPATGELEEVFA